MHTHFHTTAAHVFYVTFAVFVQLSPSRFLTGAVTISVCSRLPCRRVQMRHEFDQKINKFVENNLMIFERFNDLAR